MPHWKWAPYLIQVGPPWQQGVHTHCISRGGPGACGGCLTRLHTYDCIWGHWFVAVMVPSNNFKSKAMRPILTHLWAWKSWNRLLPRKRVFSRSWARTVCTQFIARHYWNLCLEYIKSPWCQSSIVIILKGTCVVFVTFCVNSPREQSPTLWEAMFNLPN